MKPVAAASLSVDYPSPGGYYAVASVAAAAAAAVGAVRAVAEAAARREDLRSRNTHLRPNRRRPSSRNRPIADRCPRSRRRHTVPFRFTPPSCPLPVKVSVIRLVVRVSRLHIFPSDSRVRTLDFDFSRSSLCPNPALISTHRSPRSK